MKNIKPMKIFMLVFLIVGIVFTSITIVFASVNANIKNKYKAVEATIISFDEHHVDSDGELTIVEYCIDDQKYKNSISSYSSSWSVGDDIIVYCKPENPNQIKTEIPVIIFIVFGLTGIWLIIAGVVFGFIEKKAQKKKTYLLENGLTINAAVVHFEVNRNISVNGKHPYKIEVEYDDGLKVHRFKSDNVWENVTSDCIGQTVKVYYEPSNMNNYYVDAAGLFHENYRLNDNIIYRG